MLEIFIEWLKKIFDIGKGDFIGGLLSFVVISVVGWLMIHLFRLEENKRKRDLINVYRETLFAEYRIRRVGLYRILWSSKLRKEIFNRHVRIKEESDLLLPLLLSHGLKSRPANWPIGFYNHLAQRMKLSGLESWGDEVYRAVNEYQQNLFPTASAGIKWQEQVLERILSGGCLRVGCFRYPPMIDYFLNAAVYSANGYYAEILNLVRARYNFEIEYIPIRSSELIEFINKRKVDIIPCVFSTPHRREHADIVALLHRIRLCGVVPKRRSKVRHKEDLARPYVRIDIAHGDIAWEYCRKFLGLDKDPYRRFFIGDYDRLEDMLDLVKPGKFDVGIADALSCFQYCVRKRSGVINIFQNDPLAFYDAGTMIAKWQPELAKWLTTAFNAAKVEPEIRKIEEVILQDYKGTFECIST